MMNNIKSNNKQFIILYLAKSVLYERNYYLKWEYWHKIIPDNLYDPNDKFHDFNDALNWIEENTNYTLFQIITDEHANLVLVYMRK